MSDLPLPALLFTLAAGYCVARGLWALRNLKSVLATHAASDRPGFLFGAYAYAAVYLGGGVAALLGVPGVRWVLAAALLWSGWQQTRVNAAYAAEGRKSAELAASWEYVRGRAKPAALDYLLAALVVSIGTVLPAAILMLAEP